MSLSTSLIVSGLFQENYLVRDTLLTHHLLPVLLLFCRYLLVMLPVFYGAAKAQYDAPNLSPHRHQPELSTRAAFIQHFVLPVQLLNCPSRCSGVSLSSCVLLLLLKVYQSLYHTAQLDLNGVNSTSLLVWIFGVETVLSIAKLTG